MVEAGWLVAVALGGLMVGYGVHGVVVRVMLGRFDQERQWWAAQLQQAQDRFTDPHAVVAENLEGRDEEPAVPHRTLGIGEQVERSLGDDERSEVMKRVQGELRKRGVDVSRS